MEIATTVIYVKRTKLELEDHEKICLMPLPPAPSHLRNFEPALKLHPELYLTPHHGNLTVCTLYLKRGHPFHQPASFICSEDLKEVGTLGLPCLSLKHILELV